VIARRLPGEERAVKGPVALNELPLEEGWLGDVASWQQDDVSIGSWKDCQGDRSQMCWFPSRRSAAVWQAFVSPSARAVKILEPPGLGDGQPFVLHAAGKPITVRIALDAKVNASSVQLWDADTLLGECKKAPWEFEISLKPGVHSLVAAAIEEGQPRRLSRPHTMIVEGTARTAGSAARKTPRPMILRGHERWVSAVAFSPDGKGIISGSQDDTVRVWEARTGRELWLLKGHTEDVTSVAFSPNGQRIVTDRAYWRAVTAAEQEPFLKFYRKLRMDGRSFDDALRAAFLLLLGALLDRTVLLLGGAQISSHSGKSFPMLLAGGRKLGFRHGRHLKWETDKRPASDLYLTILRQLGCAVDAFKESTGPIGDLIA
jgi:hypothetical protein